MEEKLTFRKIPFFCFVFSLKYLKRLSSERPEKPDRFSKNVYILEKILLALLRDQLMIKVIK